MPYIIADEAFSTKEKIKARCRSILYGYGANSDVHCPNDLAFLFALFSYHDEWPEKSAGGVHSITIRPTPHGTICFHLRKHDGCLTDISFGHAVGCIHSTRTAIKQPQWLKDFRAAARYAILPQTRAFRDAALSSSSLCPVTGEPVTRANSHVDHIPPCTFDQLLFDFCVLHSVKPSLVSIDSLGGTVPVFKDLELASLWSTFHESNAQLRLISARGNLQLPKLSANWDSL
jgi:hypothetical protein